MTSFEACMEYIFDHRVQNLPPDGLAEVFDRLIWCFEDNGAEILRVQRMWIESDNREKVEIALAMNEPMVFADRRTAVKALEKIVQKWPELRVQCDKFLLRWTSIGNSHE